MTSVDSNFNFLCGRPHGAGPPPPTTCVHLSLTPSPLRVDVINGWPLTSCSSSISRGPYRPREDCTPHKPKFRNCALSAEAIKRMYTHTGLNTHLPIIQQTR